ncbi:UDP-glycosyltransferase UGT5-like [Schistocerca serialis cubense]|uniref:UDP-glycosyltransferase UGT5-like n=1 Tax=Schistocerca serialis cubense TaxID=2023355 RepID=UPI00214E2DA9|nr:UDP-glycosyltransferase UGT5-like [Schistocerca serialis cubense]
MQAIHIVLLFCLLGGLDGAHFLAFFPLHGRSHWILAQSYLRELVARGHKVTFVTPFKSEGHTENWREIIIPDTRDTFGTGSVNMFQLSVVNPFMGLFFLSNYGIRSCNLILGEEEIQKLYKSNEKFDAVITEDFYQECYHVFAFKFNVPLIQIVPYEGHQWVGDRVGNPSEIAYFPDPLFAYSDHMDFFQRLNNAVFGTVGRLFRQWYILPGMDAAVQKRLNDSAIPSLATLEKQTSLMLINSHMSIGYIRPLVPNIIMVGGMHVKPPKQLPEDLKKYLDEAKEGVVYFSMGSNLKSTDMPEEKRAAFLGAFSKIRQRVLWKWEDDNLPNISPNVMISKWLPQSDILAHKNVKLFITHGGLLSSLEALHYGVPLIAIPIFGDQMLNADRATKTGYAVKLDFANVTTESAQWALSEILENPRYTEKAKFLSKLFRDRPRPPMEEAMYWTEYVVRHKGAPHMRSAALDLTWYQYLLLDVIAMLLLAVISVIFTAVFLIRTVYRLVCGKSSKVKSGGQKKGVKKD